MKTNVFVIGHPKSGTIWLARLLGDALNSPVATLQNNRGMPSEGENRPGPYQVRHGHAPPWRVKERFLLPGDKIVYTYRDPRDTIVSIMYHWECTLDEAIARATNKFSGGIANHIKIWLACPEVTAVTSFEALKVDCELEMARIVILLGASVPDKLTEIVHRQSFKVRREWTEQHGDKLAFGKRAQLKHLRKGVIGDWRNHFRPEDEKRVRELFGDVMDELGYV